MQDFRDIEKKLLKMAAIGHIGFHFCEICHELSLCETLHIHGPDNMHCFRVT